ncbi:sel1 repeat family protein (plasmid) [Roseovarius faecimaris]|uniref:Sel1 repeat family protein n=1 Tax=Roseovarius faecimaris TaxID=2494550 RepID=A0A6I6ILP9_9RHOB|nr:SEL1-like repeat protein [Roseovarius faecimaris]QGX96791.1 sel1 repeat family protein [Roseovarius faecimaris]
MTGHSSAFFCLLGLAGFLALAGPAPAQAQETGTQPDAAATAPTMAEVEQAWQRGDYVTVRTGLQHLAETTGTALAQYRYGRVLAEGRGGPRDLAGAVDWLTRAAGQNHVEAMTLLAQIYLSNISQAQDIPTGLARDPAKASDLLARAAALGHAEAQYRLGILYGSGDGVDADNTAAFNWLLAAAQQDYVEAQYELSRFYSRGIGTEQNNTEALRWLETAAQNNHIRAQFFLAAAYESGRGVEKNSGLALDWYRRAAENGLPIAMRNLGTLYLQGEAVKQNTEEGLRWLKAAAKAGDSGAMGNLGLAYAVGMGVAQDDARAAEWYNRASEYGLGRAKVALGRMHEAGRGVEQDMDRAIALYQQALETADAGQAAIRLAQLAAEGVLDGRIAPHRAIPWAIYAAGQGDAQSEAWLAKQAEAGMRDAQSGLAALYLDREERAEEGARLLERAARAGDPQAQARLGELHMTGTHVPLDYVAAHKWFNIAATLGAARAVELRETAGALMTPEQVAEAQAAARHWFEQEQPQPPKTEQTVTTVQE